jgi:subfamily B ATP-binding cassette protein MsbA
MAYFWPDRRRIVVLCGLIGLSVLLNLLAAWPVALLVDVVLTPTPKDGWIHRLFLAPLPASKLGQVIGLTLLGMLIKIGFDTVWMLRMMLNARIRLDGTKRVRAQLYAKLQELGVSYHKARPQGEALYHVVSDALGPWGLIDTFIGSAVAAVTLTAMTVIMLSRNVPLTVFALSITPLLALANLVFGRAIQVRSLDAKQADADLTTVTQRALGAIALTMAFGQQLREAERFDAAQSRSVRQNWRLSWQENLYPLAVQALFALGTAVILGYGGYLAYRDTFVSPVPNGVSAGDLIVFLAYLGQLWDPLQWVVGFFAKVQPHVAASLRLFRVLDTAPEVTERPGARALPVRPRTLRLQDVWFAYREDLPVLQGVNACIRPGQMVAFIGPSGSGKSTLLSLLARFHDPLAGSVQLDGTDVREVKLGHLRRHVALVPQDSTLFPATLGENIAYGRPDAGRDEIAAAAQAAGLADLISSLPEGYDTPVTEGGQNLSGGQRQRIAIARALLTGAPILVLDEPTSALDPEHERHVMGTLEGLRGEKTIVLVTHRIATVAGCDWILVMKDGGIVEQGDHTALLACNGLYAALAQMEAREEQSGAPDPASLAVG